MLGIRVFYSKNKLNSIMLVTISLLNAILYYNIAKKVTLVFDEVIPSNNARLVLQYLIILGGMYFGTFLLSVAQNAYLNKVGQTGGFTLKEDLMGRLFKTDYEFFIQNNIGEVWTEINRITSQMSEFYRSFLQIIVDVFHIVIYGTIIFGTSVLAGWLCIAVLPIIFMMTFFVRKKLTKHEGNMLTYFKRVNGKALESLNNVRVIKAKNEYGYFLKKFSDEYKNVIKELIMFSIYNGYTGAFVKFITAIFPIFIIFVAMRFGSALALSVGQIIVVYAFIPSFLHSFSSLYASLLSYYGTKPHLDRYKYYVQLAEESNEGLEESDTYDIVVKGVSYDFKSKKVNIPDMTIREGEKVLLVGESGIGKSTLFNILVGYNKAYTGEVKIGKHNLKEFNVFTLRELIGISFQNNQIFEGSIKENILISKEMDEAEYQKLINEMMLTELAEQLQDKEINNDRLSGGEKARIQLAQTVLRDPKILLVDETLSSVDEEMEERIISNILKKYQNKTIIMISHRSKSRKYFDKVIEIEKENQAKELECVV